MHVQLTNLAFFEHLFPSAEMEIWDQIAVSVHKSSQLKP